MTKALLCLPCGDLVCPYGQWRRHGEWRWCECGEAGIRWADGSPGTVEVCANLGVDQIRVFGASTAYLEPAVRTGSNLAPGMWRELHRLTTGLVDDRYLFHDSRRGCWAVIVHPDDSDEIIVTSYVEARAAA